MARNKVKAAAPFVSVPIVLSREELTGLDFMAWSLHLDRGAVVRRGLDLLAVLGEDAVRDLEPGAALSVVACAECGSRG